MKKNILKIALMGLAIGSSVGGCAASNNGENGESEKSNSSCSNKTTCKGINGCTGKADCTGTSGCKGKNGCTGKADCTGGSMRGGQNSNSSEMQKKREAAANELNASKSK